MKDLAFVRKWADTSVNAAPVYNNYYVLPPRAKFETIWAVAQPVRGGFQKGYLIEKPSAMSFEDMFLHAYPLIIEADGSSYPGQLRPRRRGDRDKAVLTYNQGSGLERVRRRAVLDPSHLIPVWRKKNKVEGKQPGPPETESEDEPAQRRKRKDRKPILHQDIKSTELVGFEPVIRNQQLKIDRPDITVSLAQPRGTRTLSNTSEGIMDTLRARYGN